MKRKTTLLLCLLLGMTLFAPSAFAALGQVDRYREVPLFYEMTPDENVFQIEGEDTGYALLDVTEDSESKYFVIPLEYYGNRVYDPDKTLKYDDTDENNIAYFMKHEFLETGNNGKKLSQTILDYVDYNHVWPTEAAGAQSNCPEGYDVVGGVVIPSQTEWYAYLDKFGIRDNPTDEQGFWFRTGRKDTADVILGCPNDPDKIGQSYFYDPSTTLGIRPVFYLNDRFFREVKLDVAGTGKNVRKHLSSTLTHDELLAAGYSESEIIMLSYGEDIQITLHEPELGDIFVPGAAKFDVSILLSGKKAQRYVIEYRVQETGKTGRKEVDVQPLAKTTQTISVPETLNGIYHVDVTVKNGAFVSKSEELRFAILPEYEHHFMEEFTKRGFATHFEMENQSEMRDVEMLKRIGVYNFRDEMNWHKTETEKGVYDFTMHDSWFYKVTSRDLSMVTTLSFANTLYNGMAGDPNGTKYAPTQKSEVDGFVNYAKEIVSHYPENMRYEIYNEPDHDGFWRPQNNPYDYAGLLRATSNAIREIKPEAEVMTGGIAWATKKEFIGDLFESGAYPFFDTIIIHPYSFPKIPDNDYIEVSYAHHKQFIYDYGGWKNMGLTEYGFPTIPGINGVSEEVQPIEIVVQNVLGDYLNLQEQIFYNFRNKGMEPNNKEHCFGVLYRDFRPKPGYIGAYQMNTMLNGTPYYGRVDMEGITHEDLHAHMYFKDGEPLMVVWAPNGPQRLSFADEDVTMEDVYGNPSDKDPADFTLARDPLYVTGLSDKWLVRASAQNLDSQYTRIEGLWQNRLPDAVMGTISELHAAANGLGDTMPDSEQALAWFDTHYGIGSQVIGMVKDGTLQLSQREVSQLLYDLYLSGVFWGNLYMAACPEDALIDHCETADTMAQAKAVFDERTQATAGGTMQYSAAIYKFALDYRNDVQKLLAVTEENPAKAGILQNWDRTGTYLATWAKELGSFEDIINTDILIHAASTDLTFYNGRDNQTTVYVTNQKDIPLTGRVRMYDDLGSLIGESDVITIEPGKDAEVGLGVHIEHESTSNTFIGNIKFDNEEGGVLRDQPYRITMENLVEIELLPSSTDMANMREVKVKLTNPSPDRVEGKVSLEAPEGWSLVQASQPFGLDGGESQEYAFAVSSAKKNAFNHYTFGIQTEDNNGKPYIGTKAPLSFTVVQKATSPIDVASFNGDMTGWEDAYPLYIEAPDDPDDFEQWRAANVGVRVFGKWDENYYYVLADVYDDNFVNTKEGESLWDGDSIQMGFDTKDWKLDSYTAGDLYEVGGAMTAKGEELYAWYTAETGEAGSRPAEWLKLVRDPTNNATRYLFRIPTSELKPMKMQKGYEFGFNICINDADMTLRDRFVQFTLGVGDRKNPSYWKTFTLVDDKTPAVTDTAPFAVKFN